MRTYSTKNDAIQHEIIDPLGEYADEYDIDAIANEIIISRPAIEVPNFYIGPEIDIWDTDFDTDEIISYSGAKYDPRYYINPTADFWAIVAHYEK